MTRTVITTENAPSLPAPLSQGIRKGPVLQVSGQLPFDPDTGEVVVTTVAEQTAQTLRNVTAVLEAADASLDDVVWTGTPRVLPPAAHGHPDTVVGPGPPGYRTLSRRPYPAVYPQALYPAYATVPDSANLP